MRAATLLCLLACLACAPAAIAREQATRSPVQERVLALPDGIDVADLREQLRLAYAAELDGDGRVVIVTRKRDLMDRIVVEFGEQRLVARFHRTGASVNPKYAANQLDVVVRAIEAYTGRVGATSASARKGGPGAPAQPPARAPAAPAPEPARPQAPVVPPPADGERLQI